MSEETPVFEQTFEYIVIGSGAGGGTLAARLAEGGRSVLVLEAGCDAKSAPVGVPEGDPLYPDVPRMPIDYDVPAFHPLASENNTIAWDYFVRHYSNPKVQEQDIKFVPNKGIFYPRSGCLGGCTAHNAMIMVYPHNDDWNRIAQLTGDPTWRADNMRHYFQRLENCRYRKAPYRWMSRIGLNFTRHGWHGWLQTEKSLPVWQLLEDKPLVWALTVFTFRAFLRLPSRLRRAWWFLVGRLDPNDWRLVKQNATGLHYPPLTTADHKRTSTRERLLEVSERLPGNLRIELNALVTRILFDDANRAIGVEFKKGERLYRAHPAPSGGEGATCVARASREVILAAGAFNTPQLLMLSGIGPREELEKHGIPVRIHSPGVGTNLQDRYEVCVVNEMDFPHWEVLRKASFEKGDPQYEEWRTRKMGVYTGNGAVLAAIMRSYPERPLPDLFCFALLSKFYGYFPGYSKALKEHPNYLSWAVLKAHTNNQGGWVKLKSADPRDTPDINFRYFEEGSGDHRQDLDSVIAGVKFVRDLTAPLMRKGLVKREIFPGPDKQTDEQLGDFVRTQSWGHHASCTCPIGSDHDENAVLDGNFRVRGAKSLRVVDASVFPRIPGFFIVAAIYMIGEKAADVILADARADDPPPPERSWWHRLLSACLLCRLFK